MPALVQHALRPPRGPDGLPPGLFVYSVSHQELHFNSSSRAAKVHISRLEVTAWACTTLIRFLPSIRDRAGHVVVRGLSGPDSAASDVGCPVDWAAALEHAVYGRYTQSPAIHTCACSTHTCSGVVGAWHALRVIQRPVWRSGASPACKRAGHRHAGMHQCITISSPRT